MRVIAGSAKGRRLQAVPGDTTRPTSDRVKESLFSIITPYLEDCSFLDLFAGTGSIGIEALSRGAGKCIFIEGNRTARDIAKQNVEHCELSANSEVRFSDAFSFLRNTKDSFDFIYIDPPQFKNLCQETLQFISERPNLLNENASVIVKMHPSEYEAIESNVIIESRQKKYGNNLLVFYKKK